MPLDSDVPNADAALYVEFYVSDDPDWKGKPFIRIMVPGDKNNIVEQPVREDHKERFPRQWLHFQMQNADESALVIGVPISQWLAEAPQDINRGQAEELHILKFQTVEQVATATDAQVQRVGMGGAGLRDRARAYLSRRNRAESRSELDETKRELEELKEQMAQLMAARKPGRPPKAVEG